jgi:hypothetical protein
MDPYPQIGVHDFIRLMKDFLDRRIEVRQYQRSYFDLSKKRFIVTEEEDKILQQAYGTRTILIMLSISSTRLTKNS